MKKLKKSFVARCTALFLAVLSGTAAAAILLTIIFTLDMGLYQKSPDTVISQKAQNMQFWYSAKIFSKIEEISHKEESGYIAKNSEMIRAELENYLHTDNFEFGIIHADSLDDINLSSKASYIYQNFKATSPSQGSCRVSFVEGATPGAGATPKLLESLTSFYESSFSYNGDEPKPGSVYWIISNVKNPIDDASNDIFAQQEKLLAFLYSFRYSGILLSVFLIILCLLFTSFSCYNAGSSIDNETSPVTWRHKTPLILNLCFNLGVTCICGTLVFGLLEVLLSGDISLGLTGILCVLLTAVGILSFIFLLMNLTVRHQAGILWKHTLTHALLSCVHKFLQHIRRNLRTCADNTSLLFKSSIIMIVISFLELVVILSLDNNEGLFMIWLLFKLIGIPLAFTLLVQMKRLQDGSRQMAGGDLENKIDTHHMFSEFRKHGEYLNQIRDGISIALEERLKSERFKTELITNVSHDIKTPLTSLINYVDLLQKKDITEKDRNEYLSVLERQAARLKKLIEDLIDASKASTGNLVVNMEACNIQILLTQTIGEFEEKLQSSQLDLMIQEPDTPVTIQADNRHLWRIFDNLMNNICKYAQPGTRVYINLETEDNTVHIIFRNISRYALNFSGEDLMERFVRGDVSRNTEGNGLGLSIARSLAESMKGTLDIFIDGDLFKVVVSFPLY